MAGWKMRYLKDKDYNWKEFQLKIPVLNYWVIVCPDCEKHKKARKQHRAITSWHAFVTNEHGNHVTDIPRPVPTSDIAKHMILAKVREKYKKADAALQQGWREVGNTLKSEITKSKKNLRKKTSIRR